MPCCSAYNCNKKPEDGYAVFLIPQMSRDGLRKKQWLQNIARKKVVPTRNSVVCETRALAPTVSSCLAFHDEKIKWATLMLISAIIKFACLKVLSRSLLTKQNMVRQHRETFIRRCNYIIYYIKAEVCVGLMPYIDAESFPEAHALLLMGYLVEQGQTIEQIFDAQLKAYKKAQINACLKAMGKLLDAHTATSCVIVLAGALKECIAYVGAGWGACGFLWFCLRRTWRSVEVTIQVYISRRRYIDPLHDLAEVPVKNKRNTPQAAAIPRMLYANILAHLRGDRADFSSCRCYVSCIHHVSSTYLNELAARIHSWLQKVPVLKSGMVKRPRDIRTKRLPIVVSGNGATSTTLKPKLIVVRAGNLSVQLFLVDHELFARIVTCVRNYA
ncbi:uncharacterized protein [Dermacentor andersoni]|uniref:uncharacterized protein isoform X2 n=1 Tax=Dermacentor andersoni TaxID=34620 RepID=UPI003B3B2356